MDYVIILVCFRQEGRPFRKHENDAKDEQDMVDGPRDMDEMNLERRSGSKDICCLLQPCLLEFDPVVCRMRANSKGHAFIRAAGYPFSLGIAKKQGYMA